MEQARFRMDNKWVSRIGSGSGFFGEKPECLPGFWQRRFELGFHERLNAFNERLVDQKIALSELRREGKGGPEAE